MSYKVKISFIKATLGTTRHADATERAVVIDRFAPDSGHFPDAADARCGVRVSLTRARVPSICSPRVRGYDDVDLTPSVGVSEDALGH